MRGRGGELNIYLSNSPHETEQCGGLNIYPSDEDHETGSEGAEYLPE